MQDPVDTSAFDHLPLLVFDGDSQFCRAWVDRWREVTGLQIRYATCQEVGSRFPEIDQGDFRRTVHFIETDGTVYRGAEAVFRVMARCGRKRWLLRLYNAFPLIATVAEALYRMLAAGRSPITNVSRIWHGRHSRPPTYHISSALFLRLLGVVYLIAFVSLWTQIEGLVGENGILPAQSYLEDFESRFSALQPPASAVWRIPTLAWISAHDGFLKLLCTLGTLFSVLLILGAIPVPTLIVLWLCYLSLYHVGQVFLGFQWDILLLETGFAAIFVAPCVLRSRPLSDRHPSRLAIWLLWWLLFRLMFESGAVKLTWNDWRFGPDGSAVANTWESLTAMVFHYWTQPLPMRTSWYAAQLPTWFQKLSVGGVFVIELLLPLFIFGPRLFRYIAFGGITLLMLLISGTGNYNFFNLLTFLLALTLLDDGIWPRSLQRRISGADPPLLASPTRWRTFLLVPFAGLALLLGAIQVKEAVSPSAQRRPPLEFRLKIAQFHLVNAYGLFRRMTETRPEIVIEGSANGHDWTAYAFRWKPGDPSHPPRLCAPHQPRLDWQMWFEALRMEHEQEVTGRVAAHNLSQWFQVFLGRLLTGEASVQDLLEENPFPNAPPKFIRVMLYQYRFTTPTERRETGDWWHRELKWIGPGWSMTQ